MFDPMSALNALEKFVKRTWLDYLRSRFRNTKVLRQICTVYAKSFWKPMRILHGGFLSFSTLTSRNLLLKPTFTIFPKDIDS
jgi:hypothetical protein